MKKIYIFILSVGVISASLFSCSGFQSVNVSVNPKRIACETAADTAYDSCVNNAQDSKIKLAACTAAKTTAYEACAGL